MDWDSDGDRDLISGDRNGKFNVFIEDGGQLNAFYAMNLMNGDSFDVGNNSQPAVLDWDCDGRKDLLMGCEQGYVRLYMNQATDSWPMFQDYTNVQAGGSDIYLYRVNPYVFDLDQDGRRDLICGANDGYVHFYRNIGSDTNPTFAAGEILTDEYGVQIRATGNAAGSRLGFGDWNNDGIPDFLISAYEGYVELWLGRPATGVSEGQQPTRQALLWTRPRPARSAVQVCFCLPARQEVQVGIYDQTGRGVAELASGVFEAGTHQVVWQSEVSAGIYLARLATGSLVLTERIVVTN